MSAVKHLTLEQFHKLEARSEGPRLEYWHGEAVPKPMPTWVHSALQRVLADMLEAAGYFAAVELELRIDPDWEPKPDVAAALLLEEPSPTRPVEIVAEVLSPDDEPARILAKCRNYHRIGIGQIYIFDSIKRTARVWDAEADDLVSIDSMDFGYGLVTPVASIWAALDRKMRRSSSPLL